MLMICVNSDKLDFLVTCSLILGILAGQTFGQVVGLTAGSASSGVTGFNGPELLGVHVSTSSSSVPPHESSVPPHESSVPVSSGVAGLTGSAPSGVARLTGPPASSGVGGLTGPAPFGVTGLTGPAPSGVTAAMGPPSSGVFVSIWPAQAPSGVTVISVGPASSVNNALTAVPPSFGVTGLTGQVPYGVVSKSPNSILHRRTFFEELEIFLNWISSTVYFKIFVVLIVLFG